MNFIGSNIQMERRAMLYDHKFDPYENTNQINNLVREMQSASRSF